MRHTIAELRRKTLENHKFAWSLEKAYKKLEDELLKRTNDFIKVGGYPTNFRTLMSLYGEMHQYYLGQCQALANTMQAMGASDELIGIHVEPHERTVKEGLADIEETLNRLRKEQKETA